jgi:hypothetical protein
VEHSNGGSGEGQRAPIRQQQWGTKTSVHERFVVEDKNVATHLVRNALGGRDQDQLSALLTLPSPFSRRYRYVTKPMLISFLTNDTQGRPDSRSHLFRRRQCKW